MSGPADPWRGISPRTTAPRQDHTTYDLYSFGLTDNHPPDRHAGRSIAYSCQASDRRLRFFCVSWLPLRRILAAARKMVNAAAEVRFRLAHIKSKMRFLF